MKWSLSLDTHEIGFLVESDFDSAALIVRR